MKKALLLSLILAFGSSCQIEKLFTDDVAAGIARLNVRNSGVLISIMEADENCGFASDQVEITTEGEVGTLGQVHFTIRDCTIAFPERQIVSTDCNGNTMSAEGSVTVTATRTITGTITGNEETPAIPASADSVVFDIDVEFNEFAVISSAMEEFMIRHTGRNQYKAQPRLAVSAINAGICSAVTPNLLIAGMVMGPSSVMVHTADRDIEAEVQNSLYGAQVGVGVKQENFIEGAITVWDKEVSLNNDHVLDQWYEAGEYLNSYTDPSCFEEGAERPELPLNYECAGVGPVVADGSARLLVQEVGRVAALLETNDECGFLAVEPSLDNAPGNEGTATWVVEDCVIEFAPETVVNENCAGAQTTAGGRVTVSATRTLSGWLTGDSAQPVVPMSDDAARIELRDIRFDGFKVGGEKGALTIAQGRASAVVQPRLAVGGSGACSVATDTTRISELVFEGPSAIIVNAPQGQFNAVLESASIDALNGEWELSNHIAGNITVDGVSHDLVDLPSGNTLDTAFTREGYLAGFACAEDLVTPLAFDCDFEETIKGGAARLSVNAFAAIAGAIEADNVCGFSSLGVLGGAQVNGELGRPGASATFNVQDCVLNFSTPTGQGEDCVGNETILSGRAVVSGTKTLTGIYSGDVMEPIVPTTWDPATIDLDIRFEGMQITGGAAPEGFEIKTGQLSGSVRPRTALDGATGACSVPTPAAIVDLQWQGANTAVLSEQATIAVNIEGGDIHAVNGVVDGDENTIEGSIRIAGSNFALEGDLSPDYNAATFNDVFTCGDDVRVPNVSEECNFKKTLAEGAARLIIQATGEVAGLANESLSGIFKLASPDRVTGQPGQQGTMEWSVEGEEAGREFERDRPEEIKEDCDGKTTYHRGEVEFDAHRIVRGLREELSILIISVDSIIPDTREAATITLSNVNFDNFQAYNLFEDGTSADPGVMKFETGQLSAVIDPVLGENADTGAYDIPTPVSALSGVTLIDSEVVLEAQGKIFKFTVDEALLDAFNGTYQGRSNEISGHVTVDGVRVDLGTQSLVPDFSQADFDSAYQCEDNLLSVITEANSGF